MRQLICNDNLVALREDVKAASVDLIYLDPPFNSQTNYNVFFKSQTGNSAGAQILAFEDTWQWGDESEEALTNLIVRHGELAEFLGHTVKRLGHNSLSAYLVMMTVRLVEMHRVLKPTGSLYLHCDPTASHYLKTILDVIFGPQNFRSEITWKRSSAHNDAKQGRKAYGNISDIVLYYTKSDKYTFHVQYTPYSEQYVKDFYRHVDEQGRRYRLGDLTGPGGAAKGNPYYEVMGVSRHWRYSKEKMEQLTAEGRVIQTNPGTVPQYKRYLDEMPGVPLQNIWDDISPLSAQARERLGYPTQKPLALLERIVATSSNPGDVVLDPFCGCGTAVAAAEKLGRSWIGIDITHLSIGLIKARLSRDFNLAAGKDYEELNTPRDLEAAQEFAATRPYDFQFWIVGEIGAQNYGGLSDRKKGKKGADTGIDGVLWFRLPDGSDVQKAIISVKAGKNITPGMVRDLRGTVEREGAAMGIFLCAHVPGKGTFEEINTGGNFMWGGKRYPRLQLLTVEQVLGGKRPNIPAGSLNVSYAQKEVKTTTKSKRAKDMHPLFD